MFMLQPHQQQPHQQQQQQPHQQQQQPPPPQQQQQPQQHGLVDNHPSPPDSAGSHQRQVSGQQPATHGADASSRNTLLSSLGSPMERSAPEYSQSGLPSPYPSAFGDSQSEASPADHASAATPYANQEVRSNNYSSTATPTSEYGVFPHSARSGSFPEHIQRSYHPASNHGGGSSGGMAQTPTSPSIPHHGRTHQHAPQARSDTDVPIDPSIAAPSPTYAHSQYSPYAPPPQDMTSGYQHPGSAGLYPQTRPDWAGYGQQHGGAMTPGHAVFPQTPTSAAQQHTRPSQVYSFVPIPGAQQHKRPRRRYEEIERMYKCGWQGCEKAYGTLNHLNAHVTMQSHGQKRTPEEFKEIRKEWKARKKEEEAQRKAEEERHRQAAAAAQNGGADPQAADGGPPPPTTYPSSRQVQLPPIGYQPTQYPAPPSAGLQQGLPEYGGSHVYSSYQAPASPYAQPSQGLYSQHNGGQNSH